MSTLGYGGYPPRPAGLYPIVRGVVDITHLPEAHRHVFQEYEDNLVSPFRGLTSDGTVRSELYPLLDTGISPASIVEAAQAYLALLSADERERGVLPVEAEAWRGWINAFAPRVPHGLLLDDLDQRQRDAAMGVFAAAMSPRGFEEVRKMMRTNAALGELAAGYEDTLREYMYWFTIFGTPDAVCPWGFQLYGHHACVNIFVLGGQLTISPMFLGAEPRVVEGGTYAGTRSFDSELGLAVRLMETLTPAQRKLAVLSESVQWADLPSHLAHPTEGRMRGSVARDNAVVPLDGISAVDLDTEQRQLLRALIEHYVGRLPADHARLKMAEVDAHADEANFAWAGEVNLDAPFYYKVQTPVIFIELDAHSGIFLSNDDPEPFHIHNIVRTPNGNDYGRAHLAQFLAEQSTNDRE